MNKRTGKYDQPQSLMLAACQLLKDRDLAVVSVATSIPFHWLMKFLAGTYQNPSVNRVQVVYEYLTNTKLIKV